MNDIQKIHLLSNIQMELRMIQENGHWDQLQGAKMAVINPITELEEKECDLPVRKKVEIKTKAMPYDGFMKLARKAP